MTHPIDLVRTLKAPVLGLYGGNDEAIPLSTIHAMEAGLSGGSEEARASQIHVYRNGPHAFFADYRDSYRQDLAEDAWQRCLSWLNDRTEG